MPTIAARVKPTATRCKLAKICQNNPTSVPPLLKKGLIINSQVSLTTLVGLGRGASGLKQSICQRRRKINKAIAEVASLVNFFCRSFTHFRTLRTTRNRNSHNQLSVVKLSGVQCFSGSVFSFDLGSDPKEFQWSVINYQLSANHV
jgi:hypothetical protein